jgi:hypothetical protein
MASSTTYQMTVFLPSSSWYSRSNSSCILLASSSSAVAFSSYAGGEDVPSFITSLARHLQASQLGLAITCHLACPGRRASLDEKKLATYSLTRFITDSPLNSLLVERQRFSRRKFKTVDRKQKRRDVFVARRFAGFLQPALDTMGAFPGRQAGQEKDSPESSIHEMMSPLFLTRTRTALGNFFLRFKRPHSPMSTRSTSIESELAGSTGSPDEFAGSTPSVSGLRDGPPNVTPPVLPPKAPKYPDPRAPDIKRTPLSSKNDLSRDKTSLSTPYLKTPRALDTRHAARNPKSPGSRRKPLSPSSMRVTSSLIDPTEHYSAENVASRLQ